MSPKRPRLAQRSPDWRPPTAPMTVGSRSGNRDQSNSTSRWTNSYGARALRTASTHSCESSLARPTRRLGPLVTFPFLSRFDDERVAAMPGDHDRLVSLLVAGHAKGLLKLRRCDMRCFHGEPPTWVLQQNCGFCERQAESCCSEVQAGLGRTEFGLTSTIRFGMIRKHWARGLSCSRQRYLKNFAIMSIG